MYCERSYPVHPQLWENKSGAGGDPHPFWTWRSLIYTLLSSILPLNLRIVWSNTFFNNSYFYVSCFCNQCHRTNQNCSLMMGMTCHISCLSHATSYYCISFSLMTILMIMVQGLGHLVRTLYLLLLKFLLVVSASQILLFVRVEYFPIVVSMEY